MVAGVMQRMPRGSLPAQRVHHTEYDISSAVECAVRRWASSRLVPTCGPANDSWAEV